jgi:molybdate transport system regulatory protein
VASGIKEEYKIWLSINGRPLIGEGRYRLLKHIRDKESLKSSAGLLGISYKTAYNYIRRIENNLGEKIIISSKGGMARGSTRLNNSGLKLIERYDKALLRLK